MVRRRIYFTEEDLQKRNKKHYLKYQSYFKIYGRYRYLKKKMEKMGNSKDFPKDKIKKFDEMLAIIKKGSKKSTKKPK
ncbi:MAG: hypothetical protein NY202_03175 [Mollicutes bacterium UO1]